LRRRSQARIDLAELNRIAVMHDFHEGIFKPSDMAVPGRTDRYYRSRSVCIGRGDGQLLHGGWV